MTANFLGLQKQQVITEVAAIFENKGEVPITIKNLVFKLIGLSASDELIRGGTEIRQQLIFGKTVEEGSFIPKDWENTLIYPGVKTEYNHVCAIPGDIAFIRVEAHFDYERAGRSHHASKILAIPKFEAGNSHT